MFENYRCSWNRSSLSSDLKICLISVHFPIFIAHHQGWKEGGTIPRAPNHCGGPKSHNVISTFFNTIHYFRKTPAHQDCLAKMAKIVYKNTCPSVANYLNKILLICQSHLTTDNNLKIEKNVYYFENKHNVPYSTKKTLEVRVETNIPKTSKAIIMLALCPGRCLLHHKGIENHIRQYFSTSQRETLSLQWVIDKLLIHSIYWTKRDYIAVTQF